MERWNDKLQQIIGVHPHRLDFVNGIHLEDLLLIVDFIIARANHSKESLSLCLVDLEKAFDTISRSRLMQHLQSYGVSDDMVEIIHKLYINNKG